MFTIGDLYGGFSHILIKQQKKPSLSERSEFDGFGLSLDMTKPEYQSPSLFVTFWAMPKS
jgi:hypothetical protein